MRKILVVILVLSQFAVLGFLAGEREWIRHSGERIFLRTAPIDPRDPFRGDFVTLSYSINTVDVGRFRSSVLATSLKREDKVFAVLKPSANGVYQLDYLSDRKPSGGLFLRGRVSRVTGGQIQVRYGIEQYFVQQGSGKDIEHKRGTRDGLQIPMEVEVAIGSSGRAALLAYRWSPIGIRLEQSLEAPSDNRGEGAPPRSPLLTLTLKNVSKEPLQVADNDLHCGFSLHSEGDTDRRYSMADTRCSPYILKESDVITLAPDAEYRAQIDTALPRWYVLQEGVIGSASIAAAAPNERFRMVYRPPIVMEGMDGSAAQLWQGELVSPAFNVRGRVD
ncbi:GDYXXLXY domain-containing protein [Zhongshania sp. BJYM1]|uniref:GDYXXLXY domain-containing protein n=1 Tax=Zhongshania aquatica TaxID=2965069 RepID=UPI0022B4061A|nr:GDYXXLXY domain-containing protein [Marortus sp. BJYM1]